MTTVAGDLILLGSDYAAVSKVGAWDAQFASKIGLVLTMGGVVYSNAAQIKSTFSNVATELSSTVTSGVNAFTTAVNQSAAQVADDYNSAQSTAFGLLLNAFTSIKSLTNDAIADATSASQAAVTNTTNLIAQAAAFVSSELPAPVVSNPINSQSPAITYTANGSTVLTVNAPSGTGSTVETYDPSINSLTTTNYNGQGGTGSANGSDVITTTSSGTVTDTVSSGPNGSGPITSIQSYGPNGNSSLSIGVTDQLTLSTSQTLAILGAAGLSADNNGGFNITDGSGNSYLLNGLSNGRVQVSNGNGTDLLTFNAPPTSLAFLNGALTAVVDTSGDKVVLNNNSSAILQDSAGATLKSFGVGELYSVTPYSATGGTLTLDNLLSTGAAGTLLNPISYNPTTGTFTNLGAQFDGNLSTTAPTFTQTQSAATTLETAVNAVDPTSTPTGPLNNNVIPELDVNPLSSVINTGSQAADTSSTVPGGLVASGADYGIAFGWTAGTPVSAETSANNIANLDGVFNNSPSSIVTGDYRPGNAAVQAPSQNETILITDETQAQYDRIHTPAPGLPSTDTLNKIADELGANVLASYATGAQKLVDTDPLLIDLTGNGVQLSNWISNLVLFDTNVDPVLTTSGAQAYNANGSPEYSGPDEVRTGTTVQGAPAYTLTDHQTSWMEAGTGMLVYDPSAGAITNITQTISQFLNVGYGIGQFATSSLTATDGLQALANLATPGATVFSTATSLLDAKNNNTPYWNEIMVATGQPVLNADGTTSIPTSQLESLAQAGIASINLAGTGNQGESIAGSAVTNQSTYTSTSGTTDEVAAVDFQTNTTGDVTLPGNGDNGLVINSIPEGGVSSSNSYLDQNSTARSFQLYDGTLGDLTNNVVIASGLVGFFASGQNDTIKIAAGDTSSYWLSGGSGAATLDASQASGNIMFLVNAQTTIKGGDGFNIAQVTDSGPISINLAADHLQEVVGGAGDGTFNASSTNYNVFIQGGSGNNIIIGGGAHDALSGGTGDDLIEAGNGGSVIHAGSGNDVIYGGSGKTGSTPNSDIIYGGPGQDTVILGANNSDVFAGTGSMTVIGQAGAFSVVSFHGSYADYTVTHNADDSETVTDKNADQDGPVTVKGVTDFDFADINQLATNLAAGLPVNDTVSISGNGPYVIQSSTLLANDIDYAGNPLSISNLLDIKGDAAGPGQTAQENGGTAVLSLDRSSITFTPITGFTGIPSFEYNVQGGEIVQSVTSSGVVSSTSAPLAATVTLLSLSLPTDPGLAKEWYLQAADVLAAWAAGYTGEGVSVGMFDPTGNADFTNPDLTANGVAEFLDTGIPGVAQISEHATLVAGVIGAARDGEGQVGIAYNAQLSSEAIPSSNQSGSEAQASLEPWQNYDVVNNSWTSLGAPFSDQFGLTGGNLVEQAFTDAVTKGRGGLGTIIVFASGNIASGNTNNYNETNSPDEIVVGGVDPAANLSTLEVPTARFATPGASILVSAPDQFISTTGTVETNEYGETFGSTSETAAGTSLAAPIVSGVVALMLQANPHLGYQDVQQILAYTAKEVSDPTAVWQTNDATNWNGGGLHTSYTYGFGEVDAAAAVRLAKTWSNVTTPQGSQPGYIFTLSNDSLSQTRSYTYNVSSNDEVEHVQVDVELLNANPADLTITLTGPGGLVSTLMNQPQNAVITTTYTPKAGGPVQTGFDYTFDTTQNFGGSLAGLWTLTISGSQGSSEPGTIEEADLVPEIVNPVTQHIYTDEFGTAAAGVANHSDVLSDTGSNVTLNASAVSTGMVLDLRPGSTDSVIAGQALSIAANTTVRTVAGGAGNDTITANDAGDTIVAGLGNDTLTGGAGNDSFVLDGGSDSIDGGNGVNSAVFTSTGTVPDGSWSIRENSSGAVVIDGTNAGYLGNATLTRIQTVEIGGSIFDLVATPQAGGTTTVSTPTDGAAGVVIADGLGNDTLTFANTSTSYWHAGGGSDTAVLAAGTTDVYLQGVASQYSITSNANNSLTVTDLVAGRNGTKTIFAGAGTGNIVFSDGSAQAIAAVASASYALAAIDADKSEGNSGTTPFTFTVTRSGSTGAAQTLAYTVTGSGANPANAADFNGAVLPSGSITFTAGATAEVITIPVTGDTTVEPDETFTVTLSGAAGITSATATGTIINDDGAIASAGTTTPDAYNWASPVSGTWGSAGNWNDLTAKAAPAAVAPGANNLVTVTGPVGATFQTISGAGDSASLALIGNTTLNGTFKTGTLSVGTSTTAGALDIVSGSTLTASSATLLDGPAQVSGTGAKLSVGGALTLDATPGNTFTNTLSVSNGAAVQAGSLNLAATTYGLNQVNVDGTSSLEVGTAGAAAAGKVTIDAGSLVSGFGQISGGVIDQGTIIAQGGDLLLGQVTGSGVVQIATGATLTIPSTPSVSNVNIAFDGLGATLDLSPTETGSGSSANYAFFDAQGLISGFGVGDTINYYDNQAGTLPLTSTIYQATGSRLGTLTLTSGSTTVGKLTLSGDYSGDVFEVTQSGTQSYNVTLIISQATQIGTIYQQVLGRPVDTGGLAVWQQYLTQPGNSLASMRTALAYGGETTGDIGTIYQQVLGRPVDTGGLAVWQQYLTQPGNSLASMRTALAYGGETTGDIGTIYQQVLGRPVDTGGLAVWQQYLTQPGNSLASMRTALAYGGETTGDIGTIYQQVLGRPVDTGGLAVWQQYLTQPGNSLASMRTALAYGGETTGDIGTIYQQVLGRPVDTGGLAVWQQYLTQPGNSLTSMRTALAYGGETTGDIGTIYQQVLGRPVDTGGLAVWQQYLTQPGSSLTSMRTALAYGGETTGDIGTIYQQVLGRPVDTGGLAVWQQYLTQPGNSLTSMRTALAYGGETTGDIGTIYQQVLGRPVDTGGLAVWQQYLTQPGSSLTSMRTALAYGGESQGYVSSMLQKDEGHTPTATEVVAGQTQLADGLSTVNLNTQTLLLNSSPTFIVAKGGSIVAPAGVDVFEIGPGQFGQNIISGFNPAHDILQLSQTQFPNVGTVLADESVSGGSVQISLDASHSILLQGVSPGALSSANLRFV